jgi:enamine deaminase RidA (YjgF/YER057c/UK114 family)
VSCGRPCADDGVLGAATIFYADVDDFARLNEVYAKHMPHPPPARTAPAGVDLPPGLLVSIEAIAALSTSTKLPTQE